MISELWVALYSLPLLALAVWWAKRVSEKENEAWEEHKRRQKKDPTYNISKELKNENVNLQEFSAGCAAS